MATVVIDNGSVYCKAGISGDDTPQCYFRSLIGRQKANDPGIFEMFEPKTYIVSNWDVEETYLHDVFYKLKVQPREHPVLLTEAPQNRNKYKMIEMFFDRFNVPAYYVANQAVLSLFASGRTTGIVLDSGEGVTYTVPIYEGYNLSNSILRIDLAGRALTEWLTKMIMELGNTFSNFTKFPENENLRNLKEKLCYVAIDYDVEKSNANYEQWKLPDGQFIQIRDQKFRCPELLFNPALFGMGFPGIHEITYKSIMKSDIDLRKILYSNIVLSGGTTMFQGITERLSKEITALAPSTMKIQIDAHHQRIFSAWYGGSILSSISTFKDWCITRAQYNEVGSSIVYRRFF